MDMFDMIAEKRPNSKPLAERMRPDMLQDFVGQKHLIRENSLLQRAIKGGVLGSCIFWGPPGTGKTTLANVIANTCKGNFAKLNAVTCGVADVKAVIKKAEEDKKFYNKDTYLLLDECHRFSKSQSDSMLSAIEKGTIIFIGSTTENPFIAMTPAIVSRCRVFEFKRLSDDDIFYALKNAVTSENGLKNYDIEIEDKAISHLVWAAAGDMRSGYNALELAVKSTNPNSDGVIKITLEDAEDCTQQRSISVDDGLYYDMLSAFCKSLRGSDPDAALYYSERLISAGCDPRLIARRLFVHASEDVGMADPQAMLIANSALNAVEKLGMPEGRIPLAEGIIYVCLAEKSNSVVVALAKASEAARNSSDDIIPVHLMDRHYKGAEKRNGESTYLYPHDFGGYVHQQYLPDGVKNERFYYPCGNGNEKDIKIKKWDDQQ
ncbi:MAG: replication-associated recombination protein A [Bacillota bacterium]